jgi:probable F420-dependent oxidoreductase
VAIGQQNLDYKTLRAGWVRAEELGADTLHNWDHFFPVYGDREGSSFEAMALLAAMAEVTQRIEFGCLVLCNSYRNPNLLADAARTIDHISGGRHILGIGAGWFQPDYDAYGYPFGTAVERLRSLEYNLPIIKQRLDSLNPPPLRRLPILVGGSGERVTLRIVAQYADIWNAGGDVPTMAHRSSVLDAWCGKVGRDACDIERSVSMWGAPDSYENVDGYLAAGFTHFVATAGRPPTEWGRIRDLLAWRDEKNAEAGHSKEVA